jgi:hypothetical protein
MHVHAVYKFHAGRTVLYLARNFHFEGALPDPIIFQSFLKISETVTEVFDNLYVLSNTCAC